MEATIVQSQFHGPNFTTTVTSDDHQLIADEPGEDGGANRGFDPFELVLAALATCTTATVKMYADRKGWEIKKLNIQLSMVEKEKVQHIHKDITIEGNLTEEQVARLMVVANKCPVHKILTAPNVITSKAKTL